jgi:tetratricopeptide (TPR) repeat protein
VTRSTIDHFIVAAREALQACHDTSSREQLRLKVGNSAQPGEKSLQIAWELMNEVLLCPHARARPSILAEGMLDLMKAFDIYVRSNELEHIFFLLPRGVKDEALDQVLSRAAHLITSHYLKWDNAVGALEVFLHGFPDPITTHLLFERLEIAQELIEYLLQRDHLEQAVDLFFLFVPDFLVYCLILPKVRAQLERDIALRHRYQELILAALKKLSFHCEKALNLKELKVIYKALEFLGYEEKIHLGRLVVVAALVKVAVKIGRLSDATSYFGVLTSLSHLEEAKDFIPRALLALQEAYRDTGDLEALNRLQQNT